MTDRKNIVALTVVASFALSTGQAGAHLQFPSAPVKQMVQVMATASSSTSAAMTFNSTTFAIVVTPPPVVPPHGRYQQG